jgi:hypothetical protein
MLNELRDSQIKSNDGYCDECQNDAGFLLYACPYIDMTRPADAAPEMQGEASAA